MSVVITKEDTKKEGIMLLSDLRNTLKALEDFKDLEDLIKKQKRTLEWQKMLQCIYKPKEKINKTLIVVVGLINIKVIL